MENDANSTDKVPGSVKKTQKPFRLAWAITGAGDLMTETFKVMEDLKKSGGVDITVFLSKAAVKVVKLYRLWPKLPTISDKVLVEEDANTPFVSGALQTGKYDLLLVAPTTANSVAKIVHGIADTLITNAVAMANKTDMKVYIMPVEKERETVVTRLPNGSMLELSTRSLDIENTSKLKKMVGISVLDTPEDIKRIRMSR